MKQLLFIIAAAAMMLTGCTNKEEIIKEPRVKSQYDTERAKYSRFLMHEGMKELDKEIKNY